jgi:hypothetical protein
MRKLDLAQRKGANRHKVSDPVISHYDRKMDFSLPKIRLDAISKRRTQIEYSSEFQEKSASLRNFHPNTELTPKISFSDSICWSTIARVSGICKSI